MPSLLVRLTGLLSLAAMAAATPASGMTVRQWNPNPPLNCDSGLPTGLDKADCKHMSTIGFKAVGKNPSSGGGQAWIGAGGDNEFTFVNKSPGPVALVLWLQAEGDFQAACPSGRQPVITYTLAKSEDKVVVSLVNGVSGGWAGIYDRKTPLNGAGQVGNTWGEFTTGGMDATVDVSRLPAMKGNFMSIKTQGGCVSEYRGLSTDRCFFVCKNKGVDKCGEAHEYDLVDCDPKNGGQPLSNFGWLHDDPKLGKPEGGCKGFPNGGKVDVQLL